MKLAILIPSYLRSNILKLTLPSWLRAESVNNIVVVADSPDEEELKRYEGFLEKERKEGRAEIIYELYKGRRGSVSSRNRLLKLACDLNIDYAIMADDDYILPDPNLPKLMAMHMVCDKRVGAVGGRVIPRTRRLIDPDFFLNAPINIADALTKATGYIFLDNRNGPRYAEFLSHFYMIRREVIEKINYDRIFETPTAFREESDVHQQIKKLEYKLVLDPRIYVIHLCVEMGGDRSLKTMKDRMYWKARNHSLFLKKHVGCLRKRLWYLTLSSMVLLLYRPWYIKEILAGIKEGLHCYLGTEMTGDNCSKTR